MRTKKIITKKTIDEIIKLHSVDRITIYNIAKKLKISKVRISDILNENGIKTINKGHHSPPTGQKIITEEQSKLIIKLYSIDEWTIAKIAKELEKTKLSRHIISNVFKDNNIKIIHYNRFTPEPRRDKTHDEEIIKLYNNGSSILQLVELFKFAGVTISNLLKDNNIKIRKQRKITKKEISTIIDLYVNQKKDVPAISKTTGIKVTSIRTHLKNNGIKTRNNKESYKTTNGDRNNKIIEFCKQGLSVQEIMKSMGFTNELIIRRILRNSETKTNKTNVMSLATQNKILQLNSEGETVPYISKIVNITPQYIRIFIKSFGITPNVYDKIYSQDEVEEIIRLYIKENLTAKNIGKKYNTTGNTIIGLLRKNNIQVKSSKKLSKENIKQIIELYTIEFVTTPMLAKMFSVESGTILSILKKRNIQTRSASQVATGLNDEDYIEYLENIPEFIRYRKDVYNLTSKQRHSVKQLKNSHLRGKAGIPGAFNLDHMYSVFAGFENNIPVELIAHITNLEFIPWRSEERR